MTTKQTKKIAAEAIAHAVARMPAKTWAFMHPEVAADIQVAFAIERVVEMSRSFAPETTAVDIQRVGAEIRDRIYPQVEP